MLTPRPSQRKSHSGSRPRRLWEEGAGSLWDTCTEDQEPLSSARASTSPSSVCLATKRTKWALVAVAVAPLESLSKPGWPRSSLPRSPTEALAPLTQGLPFHGWLNLFKTNARSKKRRARRTR